MKKVHELPEETKEEIRDKINAYSGDVARDELEKRSLLMRLRTLDQSTREAVLFIQNLQVKLRDLILKEQ